MGILTNKLPITSEWILRRWEKLFGEAGGDKCNYYRPDLIDFIMLGIDKWSRQNFSGFASLQHPADLLAKARYDFDRLRAQPANVYAAFDFFVTSYHILDWLYPQDSGGKKAEEDSELLLQICSHIAIGAKHFQAAADKHKSVSDIRSSFSGFQSNAFQQNAFQIGGGIHIELDGQAAAIYGQQIGVLRLAEIVLAHWEEDTRHR